jgi:hypothetical protein
VSTRGRSNLRPKFRTKIEPEKEVEKELDTAASEQDSDTKKQNVGMR